MPPKPVLPQPQNEPYWLMKKSGSISKCRGCKEELGEIILDILELDFFPKVDHVKENKHCTLSSDASCSHPSINCLRKRRLGLSLSPRDVKLDSSIKLDEELESILFS